MRRDYRALIGVVVGFIFTLIISLMIVNFHEHQHYFFKIVPFMLSEGICASPENVSISYFAVLSKFSFDQAKFIAKVFLALAVIIVIAGVIFTDFLRSVSKNNDSQIDALKIASGFSVLVSGFVIGTQNSWWNYQLLLMIPIMVIMISLFEKSYFSWINLLATFTGCLFIYCGSIEHLATMITLSKEWLGNPNVIQPIFAHSVYLRATAGLLIFFASTHVYWQVVRNQIKQAG